MKKIITLVFLFISLLQPSYALSWFNVNNDERAIQKVFKSQIKYANKSNFKKFINTYTSDYINADGFNLDIYSKLIQNVWRTYNNIEYGMEIKNIIINNDTAIVESKETSFAEIDIANTYQGELKSIANLIYHLRKTDDGWKIFSEEIIDEYTSMLYGEAKYIDIKISAPNEIEANKEYSAVLEFVPPKDSFAIASIASDIVEYPQKPTKEVFRVFPEENILERLFTSNNLKANEYIVASIGLTKASTCNLDIKLQLTGFGYAIKRVNVIPAQSGEDNDKN